MSMSFDWMYDTIQMMCVELRDFSKRETYDPAHSDLRVKHSAEKAMMALEKAKGEITDVCVRIENIRKEQPPVNIDEVAF